MLSKASYPPEEVSWLLATAWDRGVEREQVDWVNAKTWCELGIAFAPFAPSGMELQAQVRMGHTSMGSAHLMSFLFFPGVQMHRCYAHLLERHAQEDESASRR
jgi:hypothetical protein